MRLPQCVYLAAAPGARVLGLLALRGAAGCLLGPSLPRATAARTYGRCSCADQDASPPVHAGGRISTAATVWGAPVVGAARQHQQQHRWWSRFATAPAPKVALTGSSATQRRSTTAQRTSSPASWRTPPTRCCCRLCGHISTTTITAPARWPGSAAKARCYRTRQIPATPRRAT